MQILTLVLVALGIFIILRTLITANRKSPLDDLRNQIRDEQAANFARAKDIPAHLFITCDFNFLEHVTYESSAELDASLVIRLTNLNDSLLKKSQDKMLRTDASFTNLEIKQTYGATNLDKVAEYEGHFYEFIHTANNYAELLLKTNFFERAEKILTELIYVAKSDVLKTYTLLLDHYQTQNQTASLNTLISNIKTDDNLIRDVLFKEKVVNYINQHFN